MRYSEEELTVKDIRGLTTGDKLVCVDFRRDGILRDDMVAKYDGEVVTVKDTDYNGVSIVEFGDYRYYIPRCFHFFIDDKDCVDVDIDEMANIFE